MSEDKAQDHVFVTRFWRGSEEDGAGSGWRGCVDHLQSRRRRFFVQLPELGAFIAACLAEEPLRDEDSVPSRG